MVFLRDAAAFAVAGEVQAHPGQVGRADYGSFQSGLRDGSRRSFWLRATDGGVLAGQDNHRAVPRGPPGQPFEGASCKHSLPNRPEIALETHTRRKQAYKSYANRIMD